jgi:Tfp pilus assembly protein PilO
MRVFRAPAANDLSLLWLACILALCAGFYVAFYRLGAAIDLQTDITAQAASTMHANAAIAATGPKLEQTEHALDAVLAGFDIRADHATAVARFIREAAQIAALHHAGLIQIDERRAAAVDPRSSHAADPRFETIPLDVTLTGSYRDLVAAIRGLAQAPVAMRIEIASIERIAGAGESGRPADLLTARLHVSVERLADEIPTSSPSSLPTVPVPKDVVHARPS